MGCCCRFVLKKIFNFLIFFLIVVFMPNLPPKTIYPFTAIEVTAPRPFEGTLALNTYLDKAVRTFENKLDGPEHLLEKDFDIYTTVNSGEVYKLTGQHKTLVAKFGKPCESHQSAKCGRPLGMDFDATRENIFVADAFYGIWKVNLETRRAEQLVSPDIEFGEENPRKVKLFNSIAAHSSGDLYFTESSSDFSLDNGLNSMLQNPSGRLLHFNAKTRQVAVLLDQLHFANGLVLTPNEDALIVAETVRNHLIKYYLTGSKAGTKEIFLDGLPGSPDNLTPHKNGIWVPLVIATDDKYPSLLPALAGTPHLRKFIVRLITLLELPFAIINQIYPNVYSEIAMHHIGSFKMVTAAMPIRSSILFVNWNGEIVTSLHGNDGSAGRISHVLVVKDELFLGSPWNNYLARAKYPAEIRALIDGPAEIPRAAPQAPPPTTTTAAPPTTTTTTPPPPTTTTTPPPPPTTTQPPTTTTTTTPPPPTTTTTTQPPPTTTPPPPPPTTTTPPPPPPTQPPPPPTTTTQAPRTEAPTTTPPPPPPPPTQATAPPTTPRPATQPPPPATQPPTPSTQPPPPATQPPPPATQPPPPATQPPPPATQPPPPATQPPPPPAREVPSKPAPVVEKVEDITKPEDPKLQVIKKGGSGGEL